MDLKILPGGALDYLVIGHLVCDITREGNRLGGTAAYSAMTAKALGMRTGIVTTWAGELPLDPLEGISVFSNPAEKSTTFENIYSPEGRTQFIHQKAPVINSEQIPEQWRRSSIIHFGPVAREMELPPWSNLSPALLALTPQGWLRDWDEKGQISACDWKSSGPALAAAGAVVISVEDVDGDEEEIERMSLECKVLAVTEGPAGARLYWHSDLRRFRAPQMKEVDATGAGDIFASAFFVRLYATRDPWEAARFATQLASFSISRPGLDGIPTQAEIKACLMEVF